MTSIHSRVIQRLRRNLGKRVFQWQYSYFSSTPYSLSNDPYLDLYEKDGYKDIKELEKYRKLLNDISAIDEYELFSAHNNILVASSSASSSTEYFNSEFSDFHHESLDVRSITSELRQSDYLLLYDAAITTHCIHIQSRLAAFEAEGFYTIGPCGEECLAPIGFLLALNDSTAFHYRHLAANIARNMKRLQYDGENSSNLLNIIRDRARAHCVSVNDPISSGAHCLLGSTDFDYDYLVTSTLASQSLPAIGRAFGNILYHSLKLEKCAKFEQGTLSFVSFGDGSINNSHFLSGINIVDYAIHAQNIKVPLLMCVSNNKLCISLRDQRNWLFTAMKKLLTFRKYKCDGNNIFDVYQQFKFASDFVRSTQKPAIIVVDEIKRQFGHAATDRQSAYLSPQEIEMAANNDLILNLSKQFLKLGVFENKLQLLKRIQFIADCVRNEFENVVYHEPKLENTPLNREIVAKRNCAALTPYKLQSSAQQIMDKIAPNNVKVVMRKCMTYAIEEILNLYPNSVYIGEDVSHGGYYLVTDGLSSKYPLRIRDFPPDESALIGIAIGYSQAGLIPIVEIPYAKYLDCGADIFYESILMHWLSAGQQSNGILFRLQGFGNGLFGGNFHTHNSLSSYIAPGLDVVCYSNGYDYICGVRYCVQQVANGRCVMSVDCTLLLNNRQDATHIPRANEYLTFNDVICYNQSNEKYILYDDDDDAYDKQRYIDPYYYLKVKKSIASLLFNNNKRRRKRIAIITYGCGLNVSREAQHELNAICDILVFDVPFLSQIPQQLKRMLEECKNEIDCLLFSDMCKEGQNPFNSFIAKLQQCNILQHYEWSSIAAQFTYNPLGKNLTFLSKQDVVDCARKLCENLAQNTK